MNSSSKTRRVNLTRAYAVVLDIALVLLLVFSGLASAAVEPFHNTTSSISNSRPLPIVPAPWAFSIWGIIYAWLLYCVIFWTFMAWRAPDLATVTLSSGAFFLAALALVGTSLWLLLWDCAWLWWSFVVLVLVTGLLAGLVITLVKSQKRHPDMRSSAWRTAGALAVNGFAVYGAWVLVATHLNAGLAIVYEAHQHPMLTSEILLTVLMVLSYLGFALEIRYCELFRDVLSPHFVFLWAAIAILSNKEEKSRTIIVQLGFIITSEILMAITKVLVAVDAIRVRQDQEW